MNDNKLLTADKYIDNVIDKCAGISGAVCLIVAPYFLSDYVEQSAYLMIAGLSLLTFQQLYTPEKRRIELIAVNLAGIFGYTSFLMGLI